MVRKSKSQSPRIMHCRLDVTRRYVTLHTDALVIKDLCVDFLAGSYFCLLMIPVSAKHVIKLWLATPTSSNTILGKKVPHLAKSCICREVPIYHSMTWIMHLAWSSGIHPNRVYSSFWTQLNLNVHRKKTKNCWGSGRENSHCEKYRWTQTI